MRLKLYYVYILASVHRVLYVGVTGSFGIRLDQHLFKADPSSFSARYNCNRLVYFEEYTRVVDAIAREKQIKAWRRAKKLALIGRTNPGWNDLSSRA